jgi:hypothetical protein
MSTRWHRSVVLVALAGCLLVGCTGADDDTDPMQQRDRDSSPDAPDTGGHGDSGDASAPGDVAVLIDEALLAKGDGDISTFSVLLGQASQACAEPSTARRLDEVSLIAGRWAAALADGRPKVQATTENQLADVDWTGLADACVGA